MFRGCRTRARRRWRGPGIWAWSRDPTSSLNWCAVLSMKFRAMPTEFLREIPGPEGPLEALLDTPADGTATTRAAAVFAHPHPQHGGTMHTKAVYQASKALARIGVVVLRFNFRGVGRSAGVF